MATPFPVEQRPVRSTGSPMITFLQAHLSDAAWITLFIAAAGWLAKALIYERLKATVQHEFNEKLEGIKEQAKERDTRLSAELKLQEARLQAELRGRDQQLQLLQSGALSAMSSRQAALDAKR